MSRQVLDASALMAYLEKESGYDKVARALAGAATGDPLLMSVVNWGEVYYVVLREYGAKETRAVMALIDTLPIQVLDADKAVTQEAGRFKVEYGLPYADAYAAATAKLQRAELLTGDKDFEIVAKEIRVGWI